MKNDKENKNNQILTDLFFMINAEKELENNLHLPYKTTFNNKKYNNNIYNENSQINNISNDFIESTDMETEVNNLKNILISFEENYGYISPYHDDIINKVKEKKVIRKLTNEISQKIYELYQNKYYLDCYDLWSIFGFKPLLKISPEDNFEILSHLTKVKDELYNRKNIINNLDNFNLFSENNSYFETGITFKSINNKKNFKNNESIYTNSNDININLIKNNININSENSMTYNDDIVKPKINDNSLKIENLKRKELKFSYN